MNNSSNSPIFIQKRGRWGKNKGINIEKKLRSEKYKVLKTKNSIFFKSRTDKHWKNIVIAYISQKTNPNFVHSENRFADKELLNKIQKKTEEILNMPMTKENKDFYIQAKKWCVIPHNLKKRAESIGFTFLNIDINSDKDEEIWEIRVKDYKYHKNEILIDIDELSNIKEQINTFKRTAQILLKKMNYEEDSEQAWNTIIRWFTKKRP